MMRARYFRRRQYTVGDKQFEKRRSIMLFGYQLLILNCLPRTANCLLLLRLHCAALLVHSKAGHGAAGIFVKGEREILCEQKKAIFRFRQDRKSTRLNSSHANISYAVFCLKKKKT